VLGLLRFLNDRVRSVAGHDPACRPSHGGVILKPQKSEVVDALRKIRLDNNVSGNDGAWDGRIVCAIIACSGVGPWLRAMLEAGRLYGCRVGELKELKVGQVDVTAGTIHLEETKKGEDRTIVMTSTVAALLKQCATGKASSDYVLTGEDGEPIRDFRDSWTNVCKEAGVPELLFHDLRRTGVRNMIRSGIPQKVAMRISGHKTPSVFNRYDIIDQTDLQDAARKMEAAEEVRTRTSIVAPPLRVVAGRAVQ
jgi:integrase